jgi:uncharacterized protein HemY
VKGVSSLLIGAGVLLVVLGLLAGTGALSWFGHLPGDIRVTTENARIFVPITSMLVVSLVLNVLAWAFLWLFRH